MKYVMRADGGEAVECDSCNFQAPLAEFLGGPGMPARLLCEFCSTTLASRYTEYPSADLFLQLRAETWRAAACVFNAAKFGLQAGDPDAPPESQKPGDQSIPACTLGPEYHEAAARLESESPPLKTAQPEGTAK